MLLVLPSDLSVNQAAIWLDQQLFAGKPIYNTGQVLAIRGKLRLDLFERALRETIAESPGLRLPQRSGPAPFNLSVLDFRKESDPRFTAEQWMRTEMRWPISLDDPALFRFALIRIDDDHTLWFHKYHHIIIDATGRRLLSERTARRYRALRFGEPLAGLDAATPEALLDTERRYTSSARHEADRGYWLEQFAQWPGPLLDVDRRSTERARSGIHERIGFALKRADFTRLETVARKMGSSAFRVIIALSYVAFARLYDRYDIVLGLELANRPDARAKQAVGLLAWPTPMLLTLDPTMTIAGAVRQVEATRARNYPHRHFPVQELARELRITRKGHHGLFDITINYVPAEYVFAFEDSPVELTNLSYGFTSPWMVTIADIGSPHDLAVTIDTDPGLIPADIAARLASSLETLLLRGLNDPDCPLAFGGCIVLVENLLTLQSAPQRDKVRLINSGPSLLDALLRTGDVPPGVTTIILASEKLTRRMADAVFEAAPGVRLLNCYGPTEATVYSTWAHVDPANRSDPTIGRQIWNTTLHVLDTARTLAPPGVGGELFIGGAGVARGYLGRSELTAECFLPNLYGPGRLYRTGDHVRWRADGELEYMGRIDHQIKIHGIRVEPGEIEATLLALFGIAAAVVTLHEDSVGVSRLVAYLVRVPHAEPATADVRSVLERQLPRNMVPTYFVWLDALPLTPNGKLDRKALPAPTREETPSPTNHPPETRLEPEIAEIWQEILQVSQVDVQSNFFDLGGDSLALVSLFASIEAKFRRSLTVDVLAGGLTVAGLARVLAEDKAIPGRMYSVVTLQPHGDFPPFFCLPGIGGDVIHLYNIAKNMGTHRPFLGLRDDPDAPLTETFPQIAARYAEAILAHQPAGPYYLGGHSFGATVAYEVARQLVEQGHEIGLLAIIDQGRPGWYLTLGKALPVMHHILGAIPQHLRDELAQAPPGDRLRHFRRLALRWSMAALGYRGRATSMFNLSGDNPELIERYDANLRALRAYLPGRLRASLTLIRAETQALSHLALDSTLGWSDLVEGKVRIRIVPGNHGTMATEPLVRQLAEALSAELDAAQGVRANVAFPDRRRLQTTFTPERSV